MELSIEKAVLAAFGFSTQQVHAQPIGNGLINRTFLLKTEEESCFILQNINTHVFKEPAIIAANIQIVAAYLNAQFPSYLFPAALPATNGETLITHKGEYWRLSPFIQDTITYDTLNDPKQAFEAARQFGKLSRLLNDFDAKKLGASIPSFHDLELRYHQFERILQTGDKKLQEQALPEIKQAIAYRTLVDQYLRLKDLPDFPDRVMHHDTKISNVLLNSKNGEGVCVIDLDTLMPGKFISDLGDMMRTYLSAADENEKNLSTVFIRLPYFEATLRGYLLEMASILTETEKDQLLFSGKYMIYMQALRFLTDFLNNSQYYPVHYPDQNLDRAKNQFTLLNDLFNKEEKLQLLIRQILQENSQTPEKF